MFQSQTFFRRSIYCQRPETSESSSWLREVVTSRVLYADGSKAPRSNDCSRSVACYGITLLASPSINWYCNSVLQVFEVVAYSRSIEPGNHRWYLIPQSHRRCDFLRPRSDQCLGDIADKRFRLLRLMLPFRGLSLCLSRSCIVLKRQTISTRFLLHTIAPWAMSLPDSVEIWLTSVNPFLPKFCHRRKHSTANCVLMVRASAMVTTAIYKKLPSLFQMVPSLPPNSSLSPNRRPKSAD